MYFESFLFFCLSLIIAFLLSGLQAGASDLGKFVYRASFVAKGLTPAA
jgi:hypothetical protein